MHPIYLTFGLCACVWLMFWGVDEIEGEYAPVGMLAVLLSLISGIAFIAVYVWSLP